MLQIITLLATEEVLKIVPSATSEKVFKIVPSVASEEMFVIIIDRFLPAKQMIEICSPSPEEMLEVVVVVGPRLLAAQKVFVARSNRFRRNLHIEAEKGESHRFVINLTFGPQCDKKFKILWTFIGMVLLAIGKHLYDLFMLLLGKFSLL